VSLLGEYGKPIVMIFGDLNQQHSRVAIEETAAVIDRNGFGDEVTTFVIVAESPTEPAVSPFPILIDASRETFAHYGVVSVLPCVIMLDRHGLFVHSLVGHGYGFADSIEDQLQFLTGRITQAELLARRRAPEPPSEALTGLQRRMHLADQMRQRGLLDEAKAEYMGILEEDPESSEAHLGLALIEIGQGDMESAEVHARAAIERAASMPLAQKTLARVLIAKGDTGAAAEAVEAFLDIAGEDAETHYLQGRIEEERGNRNAAIEHYRAACEDMLANREWGLFTQP
jgi:hypothetical protein